MSQSAHSLRCLLTLALLAAVCLAATGSAAAADREIVYTDTYRFSQEDFATSDAAAAPRGVLLTGVPEDSVGAVYLGERKLCAGDALPAQVFSQLRFVPSCAGDEVAQLDWIPVFSGRPAGETSLLIAIGNGKNQPPVAENTTLETYRNIPIDGQLKFTDPDDQEFIFTITREPKRGGVSINRDGSYIYTPDKNKVGKDSFTVSIADSAGNTAEATVTVTIAKPTDKTTFADLEGDGDQYLAMWLREQGVYGGQTLSGRLLFQPEQTVSRGEFLAMAMNLLDIEPCAEALSTGFADEDATPVWMRPYLVAALRNGFISGVQSPEGLCFRPDAAVTQAEAAVMLRNMLGLEPDHTVQVFASEEIPAWAMDAVSCLSSYGIEGLSSPGASMTMRETARLLKQVDVLQHSNQLSTSLLAWAADA